MISCTNPNGDLDEIWEYIAQDNVEVAGRVLADIHSTLSTLAGSPQIGHRRPELTKRPLRLHVARDECGCACVAENQSNADSPRAGV